jgi:hypothetical protein
MLLAVLDLLLEGCHIRLEDDPVHGTAQGAVGARGEVVHHGGWRGHCVLLPRLSHPAASHVLIQFGLCEGEAQEDPIRPGYGGRFWSGW